ncbi:MAG: S46 family peptidase [Acidobacteriota bacterium]
MKHLTPFYFVLFVLFTLFTLLLPSFLVAGEGMWPMSEIHRLNLPDKGLEIPVEVIYNPKGVSLVDGICNIGGCTGSFVSPEGLILTNHHCAFGAIQEASTAENNYVESGFLAGSRAEEIPAKGQTVRITESYRDVSSEVLAVVRPGMDPSARAKAIEKRTKEIVLKTEAGNPGKRAEVAEMFIGKSYVLFVYTYLKDVRLVFAPPRSIGEYGGETDNWNWPRHTGDFSFFRAYVAPDQTPAEYSPANVPYHPRRFLKVAPAGVAAGDMVFLLGYPGRTFRHRTGSYLDYEYRVRMPWTVEWYGWQIARMEAAGKADPEAALKLAPRIKSLSNTFKNNQGKLVGIRRTELPETRRREEKELADFIQADPERKARYGTVLEEIARVYAEMESASSREFLLQFLTRSPDAVRVAFTAYEAAVERQKPDVERESSYMERNWKQTSTRLLLSLRNFHRPVDQAILENLLLRAAKLPAAGRISAVDQVLGDGEPAAAATRFLDEAYRATRIHDEKYLRELLESKPDAIAREDDPFVRLAVALYPDIRAMKEREKRREGDLNRLYSLYLDVKREFLGGEFVPDANGTLRLTHGRIKGYEPRDAVFMQPITTLSGVVEKHTGEEPFIAPQSLIELHRKKDFGPFAPPQLADVPVAILYDADTTGGNSGSPVFNARGELVGVNFDRVWEATINDYGWSPAYSRSIAVDIRYVLWVTLKLGGAPHLLSEMGVKTGE